MYLGLSFNVIANRIATGETFTYHKDGESFPLELRSDGSLTIANGAVKVFDKDNQIIHETVE